MGKCQPRALSIAYAHITPKDPTGSGKSSFINLVRGSNLRVGEDLESCTTEVQTSVVFELDGKRTILVDTPGFDDTAKSDAEVLSVIADSLNDM